MLKALAAIVLVCLAAAALFATVAWRAPINPVSPPKAASFEPERMRRGAELAAIGNCISCHTQPGGAAFAGGRSIETPFGTIHSTNISPDVETGIGAWSEEAFRRALTEGVDRQGRHLYPVFPYDHFTKLAREDVAALYAFLITREPVRASAPANDLQFPFNLRPLIAGWNLMFLRAGTYRPDPGQSETWNRGAYLVEALAHCGACHTPRNRLGAEKRSERFGGGEIEGWTAYALNQASPAPVHWNADSLRLYLRNGWQKDHGVARGPMAAVIDNLDAADDADINAMATYIASLVGQASDEPRRAEAKRLFLAAVGTGAVRQSADANDMGAEIFRSTCAGCHDGARPLPYGGITLERSTAPSGPNARNLINVVMWGLPPAEGKLSPIMPGFAGVLSDPQLVALLSYIRARFSDKPAWTDLEKDVRDTRSGARPVVIYSAHGVDPAVGSVREGEGR